MYSRLQHQLLTLGRGEHEQVRFDAAGVSRSHAQILRQGPIYAIHDRGSTNGTFVNGRRVEHMALSPGDVLRLGDVVGVVVRTPATRDVTAYGSSVIAGSTFGLGLADVFDALQRVSPTSLPVVIQGETGSGKECVARAIHECGRRPGPFHAVNCAALPAALAEAELFGHAKGAFTGAERPGLGHFRAADRGTLFLDEIAELPLALQAKLLRVLQEREVTPLGETRSVPLDVRVLCAVQEPLPRLVQQKRIREDLVMRLAGLVLELPPLRARREDIAELFRTFLGLHSGGRSPDVEQRLLEEVMLYDWPGNVRELELVARQLLALHGHEPALRCDMLPEAVRHPVASDASGITLAVAPAPSSRMSSRAPLRRPGSSETTPNADRRDHDLQRLRAELERNGGNVKQAASAVGISRQRAYRLLDAPAAGGGSSDASAKGEAKYAGSG
ncbi:MAG TPA: sigma 54-interacting transcriptional regulator [Polyangiaceae bacterium]|nr:sigma 54-interacting transcriptional regulator [Polyangiaceae bacterium]